MADHADGAGLASELFDHVLCGLSCRRLVVGRNRGQREVGVNTGVECNQRNACGLDLGE